MNQVIKYIVFTDASCRRCGNKSYCGYGGVILNTKTRKYATFGGPLSGRSTAYCEAWGLYRGLVEVSNIIKANGDGTPVGVLLVTDSKLNVQILTEWIPKWDKSDWLNWKKKDGAPVKNQDLYRRILRVLTSTEEMQVRITHVNSHLGEDGWERILKKLRRYGIRVNRVTSKAFISMNAMADYIATGITARLKESDTGWIQLIPKRIEDDV